MRGLVLGLALALVLAPQPGRGQDFQDLHVRFRPGVAFIVVHQGEGQQAIGTGFVVDDRSTIVTNAHVLRGARAVFARFPDGRTERCQLVTTDPAHDLAAIRLVQNGSAPLKLVLAPAGGRRPRELDKVMLISNPQGLSWSVVTGEVSARRSSLEVVDSQGRNVFGGNFSVYQVNLQAAHGSSGGPVIDRSGHVIGVLTAGLDHGRGGLNFAVPHDHVLDLDLSRSSVPFSGEQQDLNFSSNFAGTGLSYDSSQRPVVDVGNGQYYDVSSNHWGFVDPNQIGQFLDDSYKAAQLVPLYHFNELAWRNRLVHVTNAPFRLSAVVPEHYQLQEYFDPGTQTYSAIYRSLQHGNASVRILARRIVPPVPDQLKVALEQLGSKFLVNQLGLHRVPAFTYPLQQDQVIIGDLSDSAPRLGVMPGTVKFWRQYLGWPQIGADGYIHPTAAAMVLYAINGDLFVTVDFTYWLPPPGPMVAPDIVERMFIASTVSFIH